MGRESAEVLGRELLNTGDLQHTRVKLMKWVSFALITSKFYPGEFTADGFKQSADRLTGSHEIKPLD